jgi:hypothetical protein
MRVRVSPSAWPVQDWLRRAIGASGSAFPWSYSESRSGAAAAERYVACNPIACTSARGRQVPTALAAAEAVRCRRGTRTVVTLQCDPGLR